MGRVDAELLPLANMSLSMFHRKGPGGRPPPPREFAAPFSALDAEPPPPPPIENWVRGAVADDGFFRSWDREGLVIMERGKIAHSIERPDLEDFAPLSPQGQMGFDAASSEVLREVVVTTPEGDCAVIGRSIRAEQGRLQSLKWSLLGLGGAVWAVGLIIGGWMTGRALRPIQTISAAATRIADGHLDERINVAETESELGQMAGVLNASFERLEHSFEKQAQFTADAAHELRTPVSVVLSQAQLALARERDGAEYREALAACERAAKRMQSLTESLLQLSRLDAKAEPVSRDQLDLSAVLSETVELLRPLAAARQINLVAELSAAPCLGDAEKLGQVFTNLLTNALNHSADGSTIHAKSRTDGDLVEASIADEGAGIAEEHLPFLFDRFYRADESRNRNTGGAGLGLAICKSIVEAHAGSIETRSVVGAGSEFIVRLPGLV
jgi:heavy metal sensor kinase